MYGLEINLGAHQSAHTVHPSRAQTQEKKAQRASCTQSQGRQKYLKTSNLGGLKRTQPLCMAGVGGGVCVGGAQVRKWQGSFRPKACLGCSLQAAPLQDQTSDPPVWVPISPPPGHPQPRSWASCPPRPLLGAGGGGVAFPGGASGSVTSSWTLGQR